MGGATSWSGETVSSLKVFQSTLPVGGATEDTAAQMMLLPDFNPRSPWGERLAMWDSWYRSNVFQSTLPVGGATLLHLGDRAALSISIHAPRGGSDLVVDTNERHQIVISIHAPRGGSDRLDVAITLPSPVFQSTLPVGGATCSCRWIWATVPDFNPRSPWGERPGSEEDRQPDGYFNPRSPWGERPSPTP